MTVDEAGQTLYLTRGDNEVVAVDLATGQLTPFAGTSVQGFAGDGGPASDALFDRIGGLTAVPGGGLLVADSFNQRVRYIAPDSINLVGDAGLTEFHLPWVSSLTGTLPFRTIPTSPSSRPTVWRTFGGAVSVTTTKAARRLPRRDYVGYGNITITDNGNATVSIASLENVTGNNTLESTGTGTFSTGARRNRQCDLTLDGYTTVEASTAGGSTVVTMINNEATMEVGAAGRRLYVGYACRL